jgi:hypothetical protein
MQDECKLAGSFTSHLTRTVQTGHVWLWYESILR